jgi:hypothetical protein
MKKLFFFYLTLFVSAAVSMSFISCGSDNDDNDGVDVTPIVIYPDEEKTITGANSISSSNEFVALVKDKTVTGFHVGSATLTVNGNKTIPITVLPKYHLYDDPICNWGCDVDYVKSHQKQGTISSKSTSENLIYENAGAASVLMYTFKNGTLSTVAAVVSTNHTSQYSSYLSERYMMIPYYEGKDTYFVGADAIEVEKATTAVILQVYSATQLVAVYTPANKNTKGVISDTGIYEENAQEIFMQLKLDK